MGKSFKTITIERDTNFEDLAFVYYGNVDAARDLAVFNCKSTNDDVKAGKKIKFPNRIYYRMKTKIKTFNFYYQLMEPLYVGVFFDGTDNDKDSGDDRFDKMTNVGKLSEVYKDDQEKYFSIYIRGVGSGSGMDGIPGSSTGYKGKRRIQVAFNRINARLNQVVDKTGTLDNRHLILDVFGFSRGAALARHFVNVVHKKAYKFSLPLSYSYQMSARFLGIFDTVASFGVGGNNVDIGYNFHIDKTKTKCMYHIVAQDEKRANFDLQAIYNGKQDAYDGWFAEVVHQGVHSDVGGGYASKKKDGARFNNELARISLKDMHQKAIKAGVPFLSESEIASTKENIWAIWPVPDELQLLHNEIIDDYKNKPNLQKEHFIYNGILQYLAVIEEKIRTDWSDNVANRVRKYYAKNKETEQFAKLFDAYGSHNYDFNAFLSLYKKFYDKYVHISHAPFSFIKVPGTGTKIEFVNEANFDHENRLLYRDIFLQNNKNIDYPVIIANPDDQGI